MSSSAKTTRTEPGRRRPWVRHAIAGVLLLAAITGLAALWLHSHWQVTTDNAYVVGNITPVSAEVGGTVVALYADDNMVVAAGDPLAQIDPVPYQLQVDQAQADLRQARADAAAAEVNVRLVTGDRKNLLAGAAARRDEAEQVVRAAGIEVMTRERIHQKEQELLAAVRARVPGLDALARNAADIAARFDRLAAAGAVAGQERDNRDAAARDAAARLASLKGEVAAAERQVLVSEQQLQEAHVRHEQSRKALANAAATVGQAEAAQLQPDIASANSRAAADKLAQAEARFRLARLALSNCLVRAPQGGVVSRRTIQLGQSLTPRTPFLSVVPLDREDVWVVANLREDQIARVRVGMPAHVTLDAIPDRTFDAWVESVAGGTGTVFSVFPADNATGNFTRVVQRLPVRVRFAGPDHFDPRIRPGLSARVWIEEEKLVRQGGRPW